MKIIQLYISVNYKSVLAMYFRVYRASDILPKEAPWSFKIVHSHEEFKTYYFSASSEQEMKVGYLFSSNLTLSIAC